MMKSKPTDRIQCQVCDREPAVAYHGDAPMCPRCWFDRERKVNGNNIPKDQAHYWSSTRD